jgi:hypothetical protein
VVDPADDRGVAWFHEHFVGVGDEVDFAAYAGEAVQGVGAVHGGVPLEVGCAGVVLLAYFFVEFAELAASFVGVGTVGPDF